MNPPSAPSQNGSDTRVYRGKSLEEVLPKVRAELGPDAVVIRRRDGLVGGVGGFFQRPFVEIEARPGVPHVDIRDEEESTLPEYEEFNGEAHDPESNYDDAQDTHVFEPDLPGAFELELERAEGEAAAWAAAEPLEPQLPETALAQETAFAPPIDLPAPSPPVEDAAPERSSHHLHALHARRRGRPPADRGALDRGAVPVGALATGTGPVDPGGARRHRRPGRG